MWCQSLAYLAPVCEAPQLQDHLVFRTPCGRENWSGGCGVRRRLTNVQLSTSKAPREVDNCTFAIAAATLGGRGAASAPTADPADSGTVRAVEPTFEPAVRAGPQTGSATASPGSGEAAIRRVGGYEHQQADLMFTTSHSSVLIDARPAAGTPRNGHPSSGRRTSGHGRTLCRAGEVSAGPEVRRTTKHVTDF